MKKLGNLKLNYLAKSELDSQEMNLLVGGDEADNCCCSCWAYGKGGSSTGQNNYANTAEGKKSIYGCDGGDSGGGDSGDGDQWMKVLVDYDCDCK